MRISWFDERVHTFERALLREVLHRNQGNFTRTAADIGCHRNTLRERMIRLGMTAPKMASALPPKKPSMASSYRPIVSDAREQLVEVSRLYMRAGRIERAS